MGIQTTDADEIFEIVFLPSTTLEQTPANTFAVHAAEQIQAYLGNPHYPFKLPLAQRGTDFQRRVWRGIARIPAGQVQTYGALAKCIGGNARAVGQACGSNPFPLVIPCHRVISAQGIGGFAHAKEGWLITTKQHLLAHECAAGTLL